jgi:hypothetical protein
MLVQIELYRRKCEKMLKTKLKPILTLDYVSCEGSQLRNEFEIKEKIISELQALKSDKAGYINTINIDYAIDIVNRA